MASFGDVVSLVVQRGCVCAEVSSSPYYSPFSSLSAHEDAEMVQGEGDRLLWDGLELKQGKCRSQHSGSECEPGRWSSVDASSS